MSTRPAWSFPNSRRSNPESDGSRTVPPAADHEPMIVTGKSAENAATLRRVALLSLSGLLAANLFATCTAFYTKEPILYRKNVAVYRVPAAEYPGGAVGATLTGVQPFPKMEVAQLIDTLGNLEYKRESAWGETHGRIFYDEELRLIAPAIVEAMANTGPEYRLIVVTRFDRDKSVLSRMERNTMALWTDEEGLNINFGEIREEIPNNDFRIDDDWTDVLPIGFDRSYPDLEVVPDEFFQLKKVRGYTHHTWAIVNLDDLPRLKYRPEVDPEGVNDVNTENAASEQKKPAAETGADKKTKPDSTESYFREDTGADRTSPDATRSGETSPPKADPTERLRKLKEALDAELISPEEYQTQRQRILDEY